MLNLDDIIYNSKSIKVSNVTHATLNSNSPFIYLEEADFNLFTAELANSTPEINCTYNEGSYCASINLTCDNFYMQMKDFEFSIDGTRYVVPPEGYTESNSDKGYACMIWVSLRHEIETIELGTSFLQNFVASYDYRAGVINLGLNVNAPDGADIISPTPSPDDPSHHTRTGLIIAIVILVLIVIIVGAWFFIDKKRQSDHDARAAIYAEVEKYGQSTTPMRSSDAQTGEGRPGREQERRSSSVDKWGYKKGQERLNLIEQHN